MSASNNINCWALCLSFKAFVRNIYTLSCGTLLLDSKLLISVMSWSVCVPILILDKKFRKLRIVFLSNNIYEFMKWNKVPQIVALAVTFEHRCFSNWIKSPTATSSAGPTAWRVHQARSDHGRLGKAWEPNKTEAASSYKRSSCSHSCLRKVLSNTQQQVVLVINSTEGLLWV